ncbi:tryptophan halogenase family protein [Sphingosinicella sp. BN140058]|uniref:tryptophan halogenase family protein n=1 Tax=Sphingosinicella sp. BN140058 TaxID=1892855 RepID=UPI001FB13A98|nr:tryptophan halogenase family protein [Sphingosinicella sp. BN140058]
MKKVVIAGGGTAGWIAAAALSRQLGRLIEIVLVESDEIGTVGVGESTIPTARSFNALLGLDEPEFMRATQATFKLGIAFEDWARVGDRYVHSFGQVGTSTWIAEFHHFWLEARARGLAGEIGDYCFELQAAEAGKFATGSDTTINYAYHLDATLYGRFLRARSESHGVTRVEGRIASVEQDPENGFIRALAMESGERVEGDLFIDCTGFRGLLIEQTLRAGYEDWGQWLATDSALAVQTGSVGPALPYTRAIAHRAGWQWRIPLQHRVGNGLVYASAHMEDDDARALLIEKLEGEAITEPRLIRYRTGRRRKTWDKNCIALGLASGFVEPLESTSIHLIMIAVTRLMQLFPFSGISDAVVNRFNEQARSELESIRDFIILHYKLTERDDSAFWRQCRDMAVPDSLAERIGLFREAGFAYQASEDLFRVDSWVQVMLGQRLQPLGHHRVGELMGSERIQQSLADLKGKIAAAVQRMPTHQAFIDRYCAPASA